MLELTVQWTQTDVRARGPGVVTAWPLVAERRVGAMVVPTGVLFPLFLLVVAEGGGATDVSVGLPDFLPDDRERRADIT